MENRNNSPEVKLLTDIEVPGLLEDQLSLFSERSIHAEKVTGFNPGLAVEALQLKEGQQVLGADFGGDKGATRLFEIRGGALVLLDDYKHDIQGNNGEGYLDSLKKSARYAEEAGIPLGISWGGPLDGSKLIFHPKAPIFFKELEDEFDGDLRNISPQVTACLNDGPAGVISGAVQASRQNQATSVLFPINGGGLGMGVLTDNTVYATEAGHVEGVPELNTYGQSSECGVFDAEYTCLEQLGANKAGIEVQWQAAGNEYMRARDIEDRYKAGNAFAGELYDHSALILAHMVQGTADVFNLQLSDPNTAVVCHGGAFKFPGYGDRIKQILSLATSGSVNLIMTKDYTDSNSNACLDGAAIAALITQEL